MVANDKSLGPKEAEIRARYAIPDDVARVLIFAESSHWDPNWLDTSQDYYTKYVESNLLQALAELEKEPRRVYSVECMFFTRLFWDRHPELHDRVREVVGQGRLRFTSTGVTSADTLLPQSEALLRDLLVGSEWLRANGLEAETQLAYFPDCFGHTPGLPSLLNAAGFTMTAFARLDGMHGMGADYDPKSSYPRPGSSAELLLEKEKSLDFVWRAPDGGQVLAHWNAFTYGQGDMIAYRGFMRMYIFPSFLYAEDRSDKRVAGRIKGYIDQLAPLSRTPYLFCPLGMDFVAPVPDLLELLDRYNELHYPQTGTWVVNAGLEDYLQLVDCHREALPVIDLDPNPYWTGFYTSRPALKKRCHVLLDQLLEAEKLSVAAGRPDETLLEREAVHRAWWDLATSNHHDFITGTSPDAVVEGEQIPMLDNAIRAVGPVRERLAGLVAGTVPRPDTPGGALKCETDGDLVRVTTPHYAVEFDQSAGGGIRRVWNPVTGDLLLDGISNEFLAYRESGGLWRMGMEYRGGRFKLAARSGDRPSALQVRERPDGVELRGEMELAGSAFKYAVLCRADSPWLRFRMTGRASPGATLTARFRTGIKAHRLSMENPAAVVARPARKIYEPNFWPVQYFCHLQDESSTRGAAFLFALPGAAAFDPGDQALELVALRNATREKAYGILPILACPASGNEKEIYTFQYALAFTGTGGWAENRLPQKARAYARDPWRWGDQRPPAPNLVRIGSDEVWLEALKPAWRGEGIILRLCSYAHPLHEVALSLHGARVDEAFLCDALERDLQPLEVEDGVVRLKVTKNITTLRLVTETYLFQ